MAVGKGGFGEVRVTSITCDTSSLKTLVRTEELVWSLLGSHPLNSSERDGAYEGLSVQTTGRCKRFFC